MSNLTDKPIQLFIYAANGFNTDTGKVAVRTAEFPKSAPVTWLKFSVELGDGLVVIPPKKADTIPFRITVPPDATPGDYAFGVAAIPPTQRPNPQSGQQFTTRIVQASAVAAVLRVQGPLSPSVHVTDIKVDTKPSLVPVVLKGETGVTATVRNDGNTRLRAKVQIQATDVWGHVVHTSEQVLPTFLPGSSIAIQSRWHDTPFFKGSVRVNVTTDDGSNAGATRDKSFWSVPWRFLLVVLGVLGAAWYWRRRRRRRADGAPVEAGPVGTPSGDRELVRT